MTRPGEVLFERTARAAVLAALAEDRRRAWCGPERDRWRSHKAVTRVRSPAPDDDDRTDERSEPFAWTVMNAAAVAFGLDDATARDALIGNLRRWSKGKALTKLEDRHENTYFSLERTLLPTIVAFSLVRDHPDYEDKERKRAERWLNRLVRLRGVKRPDERGPVSSMNNHRYLSDSVDMAWGALRGNDDLFRQGVESYLLALGQMRPDGSLPLETGRGARALWYQRQAVASLVTIAEMAAVQGYDLYGLQVEGRDLHEAVRFLTEAIEDQRRVWPYAAENPRPGDFQNYKVQDRTFLATRGHGRHYMAWLEPYRARFPERAEAQRLWHQIQQYDAAPRPMIDDFSGGNTTCFFALPED